jgi:hypothetical protein
MVLGDFFVAARPGTNMMAKGKVYAWRRAGK